MAKKSRSTGKDRQYPLEPDLGELREESRYVTGSVPGGEQVIIMLHASRLHAYWFDRKGKYLRQESRDVSGWLADKPLKKRMTARLASARAWVHELRLTQGKIQVQKLSSDSPPRLSIQDYPAGWDGADWGEGESLEGMQEWWNEQGAFVLELDGFEHNINGAGKRFQ